MSWSPASSQAIGRALRRRGRDKLTLGSVEAFTIEDYCIPMSDAELRELARAEIAGEIIGSWHEKSAAHMFLPLENVENFSRIVKKVFRTAKLNRYYGFLNETLNGFALESGEEPIFTEIHFISDHDYDRLCAFVAEMKA